MPAADALRPEDFPASGIELAYLADYPQYVPLLAEWHDRQWRHFSPRTVSERRADLTRHGRLQIPTTIVARRGDRLLGSASLVHHDLPSHDHLSPWLASVFVTPAERGKGVGSLLVRRVMEEAQRLKFPRFYLFTPDRERFYRRLGWRTIDRSLFCGEDIVVMACEFAGLKADFI